MNVPRGTLGGTVRRLAARDACIDAFREGTKTVHRVPVTCDNSIVTPGHFSGLDLESGRAVPDPDFAEPLIRARCRFDSGAVRVVSVAPVVAIGDFFWVRAGKESRAQSSMTLEVVGIGVARLQDMTDAHAIREGAATLPERYRRDGGTPRDWFARHWDSRHWRQVPVGASLWAANPWVWIYGFKIYRQNFAEVVGMK